ncbi:MAG TPA: YciI family protein [Candidatus Limnocylindrales bacterium]|nr:YciI family protein [Candidatus Limnocylindrales bacterium]
MTNPEIPDGVSVETVYAVEISYAPDAAEKRPAVRREHLTRVARLRREGKLVEAGGFLDFKSALLIFRVGSEQEAIDIIRDDVYLRSGVWLDDPKARAWARVVVEGS